MKVRIGTRRSNLALWQANHIADELRRTSPGVDVEIVKIVTKGDQRTDVPLSQVGGKGLFVKEIEDALYRNEIDLAVHSLKDMPGILPDGLILSCIPPREDARDAFIAGQGRLLKDIPQGGKVGSSSLRRVSQIMHLRPDMTSGMLRGNVETRLRKLDEGEFDVIILAYSGLKRLGLDHRVTELPSLEDFVPAVGQGSLAIETREDDDAVRKLLAPLHDRDTNDCVTAERGFLIEAEGSCQVPLAAHARLEGEDVVITGLFASLDGKEVVRGSDRGRRSEAGLVGTRLARHLLEQGGRRILDACNAIE